MATLTGELISETYDSLLKVTDNNTITGVKKRITDGFGNEIPLLLSSTDIEIDGKLILSALGDTEIATKFVTLKADNSVAYRAANEVLSDIGGASASDLSNYVTLATAQTITGQKTFTADILANAITLDPTPATIPTAQGSMYFDEDEQTIAAILNGSTMKIGEDSFIQIKNQSGVTIPKGTAVRFDGVVGASGRILAVPFLADGTYPSLYFLGVTYEDILDGGDGKALIFGKVRGINTNAYPAGTVLYASTTVAGGYQTTAPIAPNNIISVAAVVTQGVSNGTILVRPLIGSNINNDEGVKIVSAATGDLLQLQANGLWENKTVSSLGLVPQSRTLTINGTSYDLSANRSWTIPTHDAVTIGTANGLSLSGQVLSLGLSSSINPGALSASDWITFNNKQNALTVSSPLSISTGPTPNIAIQVANSIQNGYLSSTDWTTFNSKVSSQWTTSGSNIYYNSGNVGIGTTSPGQKLTVQNAGDAFIQVRNSTAGQNVFLGATSTDARITNDGATPFVFLLGGSERMRITSSGNVGIGTTSPSAKLHIASDYALMTVSGSNNLNWELSNATVKAIYGVDGANSTAFFGSQTNHAVVLRTNNSERLRINSSGNVLIGTTTDNGAKLQVSGDVTANTYRTYSGSVSAPSSTFTTVYTFANTDNMAGYFTVRFAATNASLVCFFTKTYDGGSSVLTVGSITSANFATVQSLDNNKIQVRHITGVTVTAVWGIQRIS